MTTIESSTPLSAAPPLETARTHEIWAAPIIAVAATGLFALVVNLVRYGFAGDWVDPAGYVVALLKPLILTLPGYLVLRIVIGQCDLAEEISVAARSLRRASLSIICYAPVIWFYLVTSPSPAQNFPIIAFSFGAVAFWAPLALDLGRRGGALSIVWIALMLLAEARTMLTWLAEGIAGRMS